MTKEVPGQVELHITAFTWTRESHGLYDYEGTEVDKKQWTMRGNLRVCRDETYLSVQESDSNFYQQEQNMLEAQKEQIIARVLNINENYWVYHKNFVDS
jgi:hypothetical protein